MYRGVAGQRNNLSSLKLVCMSICSLISVSNFWTVLLASLVRTPGLSLSMAGRVLGLNPGLSFHLATGEKNSISRKTF